MLDISPVEQRPGKDREKTGKGPEKTGKRPTKDRKWRAGSPWQGSDHLLFTMSSASAHSLFCAAGGDGILALAPRIVNFTALNFLNSPREIASLGLRSP
ncbi:MAG: hypothetical protein EBU11_03235 [Gammaproteobacteria bacterium]|nr:hypothetical protein [Gammaproteobacteria bacterium]